MRKELVLILMIVLPACGGDDGPSTPSAPITTTPPPATQTPAPTEATIEFRATDVPRQISNLSTLESIVAVGQTGTILDISVDVNIEHTWRGDLEIGIQHPDGTPASLFVGALLGDSADNVVETFTRASAPELSRMIGKPIPGNWKLVVTDRLTQDRGTLAGWTLRVRVRR
jgi:subtilisin-like proprotein convertase family protein